MDKVMLDFENNIVEKNMTKEEALAYVTLAIIAINRDPDSEFYGMFNESDDCVKAKIKAITGEMERVIKIIPPKNAIDSAATLQSLLNRPYAKKFRSPGSSKYDNE